MSFKNEFLKISKEENTDLSLKENQEKQKKLDDDLLEIAKELDMINKVIDKLEK
jgi:hypothetical protein